MKERYFFTDGTPTHSYMRMLYCYPQQAFPYQRLLDGNRVRGMDEPEFEIEDTGVFDGGWFDVTVEYAKSAPDDVLMQVTALNRGSAAAPLHILPQFWARNTWSWADGPRPSLRLAADGPYRSQGVAS